jgi:hypothetical protein
MTLSPKAYQDQDMTAKTPRTGNHPSSETLKMQQEVGAPEPYMARNDVWLVIAVWLVLTILGLSRDWQHLIQSTGSTDDTMRLHQLRDLLAGKGWFAGLHDARLAPPVGLESHWSRLVDIPLALLLLVSTPLLGQNGAEIFAAAAWPAFLYLVLIAAFICVGKRLAAGTGFLPMLAGLVGCLQINFLFRPTAIDHHNLMLALSAWFFACIVWLDVKRYAAVAGGIIAAALIAIGFENLHIYAALNTYIVLRAFYDPERFSRPVVLFLVSQAIFIVLFWLATVPPHLLGTPMCDAIALNSVTACVGACLGAAAIIRYCNQWNFLTKSAVAIGTLGLFAGIALTLQPLCSNGPNAMIDPRAVEVWLQHVTEAATFSNLALDKPNAAVSAIIYPLLCLIAFLWLRFKNAMTPDLYALLACVALATLVTMAQVRGATYAALFGALFFTVAATRIEMREPIGRILRIMVPGFASTFFVFGVAPALLPVDMAKQSTSSKGVETAGDESLKSVREPCAPRWGFPSLQAEPDGHVLSHIDLGPGILLNTKHTVVMAPYHRISTSIAKGRDMIAMPAADAHARLIAEGITHLADCRGLPGFMQSPELRTDKTPLLQDVMRGDHQVDWVEALPADPRRPDIKIWRVKR